MTTQLSHFSAARHQLALAKSIDEVKEIRSRAEALRAYRKQIGASLEMQNDMAEIKIRAERRAGEILNERVSAGNPQFLHDERIGLKELEVSESQSHRWQTIASIPEDSFEAHIASVKERNSELTSQGLYKLGKQIAAREPVEDEQPVHEDCTDDLNVYVEQGIKFGTIYADPAWQYGNQGTRAATNNHYDTMTVEDICALPVSQIVADDAHLHLWTTKAFIVEALTQVIPAWGFEYKNIRVWCKPQMGIGNYWRGATEYLLLGIRGNAPFRNRSMMDWVMSDRMKHSAKPAVFRSDIEKVSPGPYLEMFARTTSPGWSSWGNQIERTLLDGQLPRQAS